MLQLVVFLLLFLPYHVDTCLVVRTVEPLKCYCPPIGYMDRDGILQMESAAYLGNRPIFYPKSVNVSGNCTLTVDAPASDGYDNYYFMIFRSNGPPIFNKRFTPEIPTVPFNPTGITCEKTGDDYKWHFYGAPIENMTFALQSNEGQCGCGNWTSVTSGTSYSSSKLYGTCDIYKIECPESEPMMYLISLFFHVTSIKTVLDDATCVDGIWYYNNIKTEVPMLYWCFEEMSFVDDYNNEIDTNVTMKWPCGCHDMDSVGSGPYGNKRMTDYENMISFSNITFRNVSATYSPEDEFCRPQFNCLPTETLAIFSMNHDPFLYTNGAEPTLTCHPTPLASSSESQRFWFLDGIMLQEVLYGCYGVPVQNCSCTFQYLNESNIQELVGSHPFYQTIASYAILSPNDTYSDGNVCPEQVICPSGLTLVVFDTDDTKVYPSGSLNVSCSGTTNNWTVDDRELEVLYATCVDYSVQQCKCSPIESFGNDLTVGDDCSLQFPCESEVLVYSSALEAFTVRSNNPPNFSCRWNPGSSSFDWFYNDDILLSPFYLCFEPTCKCSPIAQLTNSQIANNSYWKLLKNEAIWNTSVTYNSDCDVEFSCAGTGLDSYYTVIFYAGAPPIVINRVVNDVVTSGSGLQTTCVEGSDGQYEWQIYGYPVEDLSVTCVSDMDSCKCPAINASTKLGELPSITDRSSPVGKYCGSIEASCPTGGKPKIVSDNLKPITPQLKSIFDKLLCVKKDDGSHQWLFETVPLVNPSISCVPTEECACGELVAVNKKSELSNYDTSGDFDGYTVAQGNWSYDDCRETVEIQCPNGYLPVVFGNGINWFYINTTKTIKCVNDPASSDLKIWFSEGRRVLDPAIACIGEETETTCSCSYVHMNKTNILQTVGRFHPSLPNITDYLFQSPDSNGEGACPEQISCPDNYTLVVFDNSNATSFPNGSLTASCSKTTNNWSVDGIQLDKLYSVCVNFNVDAKDDCLCPLIPGQGGTDMIVERWWTPMITYGDDCQPEFSCAGAGVDSYIALLYNANLDPLYTNRVVDGVSLSSPEPRTVPGLYCTATSGNNWEYMLVSDNGIMASCYDDSNSCKCPSITANANAGQLATLKNRSSGDQCGFVEVECPDGYVPTLLSDEAKPIFALGKPVFNELICFDQQGGNFWFYSDVKLVNPSISCAPRPSSCLCEDIVVIRTDEQLKSYHKRGFTYSQNHVVESPWNFTECVSSIQLTCSGTPIVFSNEFNFPREAQKSYVLQCIPSPMDEDVNMWFFDGFRVINPAIACV